MSSWTEVEDVAHTGCHLRVGTLEENASPFGIVSLAVSITQSLDYFWSAFKSQALKTGTFQEYQAIVTLVLYP